MGAYVSPTLIFSIVSVTNNSGSPSIDWQYACYGGAPISGAAAKVADVIPNAGNSVIVVASSYLYVSPVSLFASLAIPPSQTSMFRPRSNATVAMQ